MWRRPYVENPGAAPTAGCRIKTEPKEYAVNWTLEVVVVPVRDIDRAKAFYAGKLGFVVDHDIEMGEGRRLVQLTPPGSGCSIVMGTGGIVAHMEPGSQRGLQLVVNDIVAAHKELVSRGAPVGDVTVVDGSDGSNLDNVGFVFFDDPDGNGWAVQQISGRP
jgi:catechol 2,3-dioxygenase-like lactoylglutathione lyase family enzyme